MRMKLLVMYLGMIIIVGLVGSVLVMAMTVEQTVTVTVLPGGVEVYSPVQGVVYDTRMIPINITMSDKARFRYAKYSDNGNRLVTLCRNCDQYGYGRLKRKPFDDGFHRLRIKLIFKAGGVDSFVDFIIDYKKPRIFRTRPKKRAVVKDGVFYIKYTEINLQNITLYYGVDGDYRSIVKKDCEAGRKKECWFNADLSDFNGQEIYYWFEVRDYFRVVKSRKVRIYVDVGETPEPPPENHDVGLIDLNNAIDNIFLEYKNKTDILDENPILNCGDVIKAKVKIENQGDYNESVSFNGSVDGIIFLLNDIDNLIPGSSTLRTSLTPYITLSLPAGFYNITIEAIINNDINLSNNIAQRGIEVIC